MQPSAQFHQKIQEEFFSKILITYPGSKIWVPNTKWVEPANEIFFALHILPGDAFNTTIGNKKWERTPFVIQVSVFAPPESNEREAWERAETAARVFANKEMKIGPDHKAVFRAPTVRPVADQAPSNKFRVVGTVAGWRDFAGA